MIDKLPLSMHHVEGMLMPSGDPQFPADNLLTPTCCRPWLSAPSDRSGHLRVLLQLEKASVIDFLDFGNCGAAFLEVAVGRSSWGHDQPLVTLLPMTTLSNATESRSYGGGTGVHMFGPGIICTYTSNKNIFFKCKRMLGCSSKKYGNKVGMVTRKCSCETIPTSLGGQEGGGKGEGGSLEGEKGGDRREGYICWGGGR
uniref:DNA-repair protein Xrcc1 N-terminal domain-containing protein n=1 Tax=Eptatretus burgeri TaxID=7764 RepID=A0A8C4ND74_EPTBU